jgi:hypothetical protein
VPHPCHQVDQVRAGLGGKRVTGVPQIVEVQALPEPSRLDLRSLPN